MGSFLPRPLTFSELPGPPAALLQPEKAEETVYLYEGFDQSAGPWATKYRVSLGPDQWPAPPPPTWREHLKALGDPFETQKDFYRVYRERRLTPEDLDQRIDGYSWEDYWEQFESLQAKAHQLLKKGLTRSD